MKKYYRKWNDIFLVTFIILLRSTTVIYISNQLNSYKINSHNNKIKHAKLNTYIMLADQNVLFNTKYKMFHVENSIYT